MKVEESQDLLELDADEAWVAVHETAELLPIEGISPRQLRVRLEMNGWALVNAQRMDFDLAWGKVVVRYVSYRRGSDMRSGALVKELPMRAGDTLTFKPGQVRLGLEP